MSSKKKVGYKIKTKRGAKKRFKITGTGKVRFRRAGRSHINTKRSAKKERHQRGNGVLCESDAVLVRRQMPYDI